MSRVVPAPVSVAVDRDADFHLGPDTVIRVGDGAEDVGEYLAGVLRPSTGYGLAVVRGSGPGISLELRDVGAELGVEGYRLDVTRDGVVLAANTAAGLFAGVQTLRQLLPAEVENRTRQPGPWPVAGGRITDYPRFAYRGAMLDVARHFFTVDQVKRYVDQLAIYKVNHLHLHLTDDQGWRIEIESWPLLTAHGGSTQVGGGDGGYYTKAQYRELVAYAASRHITVVPEIDLPGHTNAALAAYADLNADGVARQAYTGIEVGFSSLCVDTELTYEFVQDVITELADLTPGPYLHLGGDEALRTTDADFTAFFDRVLPMVAAAGKTVVGWHEYLKVDATTSAVGQFWGTTATNDVVVAAAARGNRIIMSPADRAYLDMKYDESSPLGLSWAGFVEVDDAYDWNPTAYIDGLPESAVLGVEAPLWTETVETSAALESMAFPRLPAIAELGWSPWSTHDWSSFRSRLAEQAHRWKHLGIAFHPSPKIDWP